MSVVLSPFYPVSDRLDTSHRSGWARYWANELSVRPRLLTTSTMDELTRLKRGEVAFVYHGMAFKGQLNLQSGLTDEILARTKRMIDAAKQGVKFISLDTPMPDYGRLFGERGMDPTSAERLSHLCSRAGKMLCPNQSPDHLVIGDSHALSLYVPGSTILRHDGKTLHGALTQGGSWGGLLMDVSVLEHEWGVNLKRLKRLTFYYGNIDLRHHLCRFPDLKTKITELVRDYGAQLDLIAKDKKPDVLEVVLPLPIEDESRPIPKSGWYKGSPFFGSWSARHQARLMLRDSLKRMAKKRGFQIYEHPRHFTGRDGKLSFDVMELPRSVHIRPSEYRLVQEGKEWSHG